MKYIKFFIFIYYTISVCYSFAQGCSDAGFCTMGALRPDQEYSKRKLVKLRSLDVGFYRGKSTLSPVIYSGYIDFSLAIGAKNSFQVKLPYTYTTGRLGESQGLGDISLAFTRNLATFGKNWSLNGTIGTKIPTNMSTQTTSSKFTANKDVHLHMYYQTSLGSYDAIAGISAINRKWMFATGIQMALTKNSNNFLWKDFPNFPDQEYLKKYATAPNLLRGIDVMFRVERNFRFTNFNFTLGALPIYRIKQDEKLDPKSNKRVKIDGTTGLALSIISSFGYQFDTRNSIKLMYGRKIMDRKVNPDGLTRHDVMNVTYSYKF